MNIWLATILTFMIALIWIRSIDFLAHRNIIPSNLSRKIIHVGTGPIFVLCWLLFPENNLSRYLAALVPLMITFQFALVGLGLIKDESSVKAMSRSGKRQEILKGPLIYGIVFVLITIINWKNSPVGLIALMILCGGDGMADIIGNLIPKKPLPWSKKKSIFGSLGMLTGGWILSILILSAFSLSKVFPLDIKDYLLPILVVSFVATLVESLPLEDIDNITVPVSAILTSLLFF